MKCALQVSRSAAFPYARADRGEPAPRQGRGRSSSCSTPASSTTTATSTSFVEYAKADPEDIAIRITALQPRAGAGAAPPPAAPVVPQHLGLGRRAAARSRYIRLGAPGAGRPQPGGRRPAGRAAARTCPSPTAWARGTSTSRTGGARCSPTTRRTAPRVFGPQATQPHALRQGRVPPPRRATARTASTPTRSGTKACAALPAASSPAGGSVGAPAASHARAARAIPLADVDADRRRAAGRGRRVLRGHPAARRPAPTRSSSSARRSPGCCGPSRSTSSTCASWLDGDDPRLAAARLAHARSATATGAT